MPIARVRLCAFVAVAFCFVLTSAVSAATVIAVTGKVSINRGDGFAQISSATSAKPGDRVMAGFGGTAEIVYDNGCRQQVEPGSLITVVETPPCEKPAVSQDGGWVTQTTEEQKTNLWPYALGAVAVGGIAAVVTSMGGSSGSSGDGGGGGAGGGSSDP
jgi:hypothetical protein